MHRITLSLLFGMITLCSAFSQSADLINHSERDTAQSGPVNFTVSSASEYIVDLLEKDNMWRPTGDTMKLSLRRLIDHYNEPFDSVQRRLIKFKYDSVTFKNSYILKNDTIPLRWLNDTTFIVNNVPMEREPFITERTIIRKVVDTSVFIVKDIVTDPQRLIDSLGQLEETLTETFIDSTFLESKNILMHNIRDKIITPPLIPVTPHRSARMRSDSSAIIISDTVRVIVADRRSPFYIVPSQKMTDSLKYAVETLLSYTENRDSILLYINDMRGRKTPFWLTTGSEDLNRYWVKNYKNDSITIWMGNPSKNDITLILEEDVNVARLKKETAENIPIIRVRPQRSLAKVEPLKIIPEDWNYNFSSTFGLNETYISNWSKGGESSLAGILDIKGGAKYTNTENKTQWTNSGRLKYGAIVTEENGFRTNTDMLELNSQYNKLIKNKIDFSTVFYLKTQVSRGYNYPNDSVVISKFLNPGTFTIGMGLEYKPFKKTEINFSMLSYKNTFVLDTAHIDQTIHGVAKDKRAKQEMGGQLLIKSTMSIFDGLNITNSLRLFSGYLNKPENIDVDWEINLDKKIKWYFSIALNLHMIYDDDIRFPVLDKNDKPVILPDGSKKKSPKLQFKQFLGLTFSF